MSKNINYWGFRVDRRNSGILYDEMKQGRLRQGWGWLAGQDLRKLINKDKDAEDYGAGKNLPMFRNVKQGDILLVAIPYTPTIAIVKATDNWNDGYKFEMLEGYGEYGHIFPVEYLTEFHRRSHIVHGDIRKTFKCRRRFWGITAYSEHIENILAADKEGLNTEVSHEEKLDLVINKEFNEIFNQTALDKMLDKIKGKYDAQEWEKAIKFGLGRLIDATPAVRVDTTPNSEESEHGADLLIYLPNPIIPSSEYVIAVQIKDHDGSVGNYAIDQICRADKHFAKEKQADLKLIEKMVLITKAEESDNQKMLAYAKKNNVTVVFKREFEDLLSRIANCYIDIGRNQDNS